MGAQAGAASKASEFDLTGKEGRSVPFRVVPKQGPNGIELSLAPRISEGPFQTAQRDNGSYSFELRKKKPQNIEAPKGDIRSSQALTREVEIVESVHSRFSSPHLDGFPFPEKVEINNLVSEVEGVRNLIPALLNLDERFKAADVQSFALTQDPGDLRKAHGALCEAYDALNYGCKNGTAVEVRSAKKRLQSAFEDVQGLLRVRKA